MRAMMGYMRATGKIFIAIFFAGIASLLMELSLLREFVYVIGNSAFSNALIISVFLAGLAAGTYVGIWKRFKSKTEYKTRKKFAFLQLTLVIFIFLFYLTKEYFIYVSTSQLLVIAYFIFATFVPSLIAGASYATVVELLYHKGERYIVYIYAVSTLGNVIGGLLHGYVFTYLTGIQASYTVATLCAAVAISLVYRFPKRGLAAVFLLGAFLIAGLIQGNVLNARLYTFNDLLFRKYSPSGLVEIWRTPDGEAVEMTTNNVHEYYSYDWDKDVHRQWAETTMEATRRPVDVLLLGYGSGISSAEFLKSPMVRRVDTIENTLPVLEAGQIFFPDEYKRVSTDPRSHVIMRDFRNYIRFTDKTYDIVLLDHSIIDPYYSGFFTVEFFDQLKRILKSNGVIASLGVGLSYDTMRSSFPYVYTYTGQGRELISDSGFFLTMAPLADGLASSFTPEGSATGETPIYSDHRIYGNSITTALTAIKRRISRSLF